MARSPSAHRASIDNLTFKTASVRQLRSTAERRDGVPALLSRIRGEFAEMPGLSLTGAQASRLLGVPESVCMRSLQSLVDSGVLRVRGDGRYVLKTTAA